MFWVVEEEKLCERLLFLGYFGFYTSTYGVCVILYIRTYAIGVIYLDFLLELGIFSFSLWVSDRFNGVRIVINEERRWITLRFRLDF